MLITDCLFAVKFSDSVFSYGVQTYTNHPYQQKKLCAFFTERVKSGLPENTTAGWRWAPTGCYNRHFFSHHHIFSSTVIIFFVNLFSGFLEIIQFKTQCQADDRS